MNTFNDLHFEALDDTIRLVLGETVSNLIHAFTERQTSPQSKATISKKELTIAYLEKLLGKEGAQLIEATSIRHLYLKLKREYEEVEAHFSFLDELYEMKFKLLSPLLNEKQLTHN